MKNITEEHIKEIAEFLDMGLRCFFNKKTGEVKDIIDFDDSYGDAEELLEEEMKEIEKNIDDYLEFEKISTRQSFGIMEDFADSIEDKNLQERLYGALGRKKPFRNFRWEIDEAGDYRDKWFEFKAERYKDFVRNQAEFFSECENS